MVPLRRPGRLRGLPLRRARPARRDRRATATSAATTSALYVDDLDAAVDHLRAAGVHGVSTGRPRARGPAEGNRWIYFLSPWGMQFELVSYPDGKAWDREHPRDERLRREQTSTCRAPSGDRTQRSRVGAGRVLPARPDPARRPEARATGSGRRRSPSGSAPAGSRCARRCGCSRPRGSTEHEPHKGARVPRLSHARGRRRLPDARAARAARAGREPAAADRRRPRAARGRAAADRGEHRPRTGSSSSTASSTSAPTPAATSTR